MISQDRQMIVDGFRHKNFGNWTIFGRVIAILVKIMVKSFKRQHLDQIRSFLANIAVTRPKMVQFAIFLCLNPSTIICLSCENIHVVKMTTNKELTGEETHTTFKIKLLLYY